MSGLGLAGSLGIANDMDALIFEPRGAGLVGERMHRRKPSTVEIVVDLSMQWVFVTLSMKRLVMLRRGLSNIAQLETSQSSSELPDRREVQRLVALVQKRLERSRLAIGNLAHTLKTPLALIFRMAENPELRDKPAVRQAL